MWSLINKSPFKSAQSICARHFKLQMVDLAILEPILFFFLTWDQDWLRFFSREKNPKAVNQTMQIWETIDRDAPYTYLQAKD